VVNFGGRSVTKVGFGRHGFLCCWVAMASRFCLSWHPQCWPWGFIIVDFGGHGIAKVGWLWLWCGQFFGGHGVAEVGFGGCGIAKVDFGGCGITEVNAPFAAMHCQFLV